MEVLETGLPSMQQGIRNNVHFGLLPMVEALQCPVEQDEHTGTHLKCGVGVE